MKGKHGKKAAARRERLDEEQARQSRLQAAAVADALQSIRSEEEAVAQLADRLFHDLAAQESADALETARLARETEALIREAASKEACAEQADRRFKRWYQVLCDEIGRRSAVDVRPRLIPDSGKAAIAKGSAVKIVGLWANKPHHPWRERFLEREFELRGNKARPWEGLDAAK